MLTQEAIEKTLQQMRSFGEGQHRFGRERRPARRLEAPSNLPAPTRPDDEPAFRWCDVEQTYVCCP